MKIGVTQVKGPSVRDVLARIKAEDGRKHEHKKQVALPGTGRKEQSKLLCFYCALRRIAAMGRRGTRRCGG